MNSSLADALGVSPDLFHYLVLPLMITVARIMDVSINTVRIIFMLHSKKTISTVLGFFEALVWIVAIGQIFQNLTSWPTYLAYSVGFAAGIWIGMVIEEKLAIGRVIIRAITFQPAKELLDYLEQKGNRYTSIDADSADGKVTVLYTVVKRDNMRAAIDMIKKFHPNAYYTVEGVKRVSDEENFTNERGFFFKKRFSRP